MQPKDISHQKNGAPGRTRTGTAFAERFSYHFGFRRRINVRGLDFVLTLASHQALGPRRQVSARSIMASLSVASHHVGGSLNLTGFTRGLSLPGAQIVQVSCVYLFHHGRMKVVFYAALVSMQNLRQTKTARIVNLRSIEQCVQCHAPSTV